METKPLINGVVASVVTPFNSNGEVDIDRFRSEVTLLDSSPVDGICVGGLLSGAAGAVPEELGLLTSTARKATKKPLFSLILPDVAVEAGDMLNAVTEGGADAVLVAQPHYLCQPGGSGLAEMFERLRPRAKTPLLLADCLPEAKIGVKTIRQIVEEQLVDGVWEAADAHAMVDLLCLHLNVPIYCGVEDLHYVAYMLGVQGSISDLASVFPKEVTDLYRSFKAGNHEKARAHHERLARIWRVLSPAAAERESRVRSALAAQGREVGAARSPYNFLAAETGKLIQSTLKAEGLVGAGK